MLLVPTYIDKSPIHGVGVFAAAPIAKGTETWRFVPGFDVVYTETEIAAFPALAQDYLRHYTYFDPVRGARVLCGDNARFMNHDDRHNTAAPAVAEQSDFALRDIAAGEEITCNYNLFDGAVEEKLG
jgi:hypothetical protein